MTHSAKRARRKRLAQEAQQRKESPRSGHQMDPLNLSGTETDKEEEEDDHEILFPARVRESEERAISPMRAQETMDCDIVNMVKILNGVIAAVSQDTARIQRAYQQLSAEKNGKSQGLSRPNRYGQRIQLTGGHETIWPVTSNHTASSDNAGGRDGRRRKSTCRRHWNYMGRQ